MSKKLAIVLSLMSIIPLAIAFGIYWFSPLFAKNAVTGDETRDVLIALFYGCLSGGITVGVATLVMWAVTLFERRKLNREQ